MRSVIALLCVALFAWSCPVTPASADCTLRVATSGDYAPFSLKANDKLEGFDIDLVGRLAADLECTVQFVPFAWPELNAKLAAGAVDLVASGVTMRPERALIGRFSRPYAVTGAVALVAATTADRFRTLQDLDRSTVRIAVNAGGHLERVARALLPHATITPVTDNRALPQTLRAGAADAVITDSAEARAWLSDDLRALGPFTHDYKALLLPAQSSELAARVDAWLRAREDDGWLVEQRKKYVGADAALDDARIDREAVAALIRLRLELMPLVAAAKRAAHLPIEDKTQERRVLVRVAAQVPAHAERVTSVYTQLIEMAKAIQRAYSTGDATASLDTLRDALGRIDDQLVREIDGVDGVSTEEWQALLDGVITVNGIEPSMRATLATALAKGPASGR